MEQLGSQWMDFHEIWYLGIFQQCVEKVQVSFNLCKNNGHSNLHFWSSRFSLGWNIYQEKVVDKIKTHIICSITFFFPKIVLLWEYEKNVVEPGRPQMTIRHISIAFWARKATNTHSEYVILIAFPPQQRSHECVSVFRYTYNACLVKFGKLLLSFHREMSAYNNPCMVAFWTGAVCKFRSCT
jgi:hypothetical protein